MSSVNIHSEFQPLEEVILGDCYVPGTIDHGFTGETALYFEKILAETKEDLDNIAAIMAAHGIVVRRPEVIPWPHADLSIYGRFKLQWPSAPLISRDFMMCIGDTVLQTYGSLDNRWLEDISYRKLFAEYLANGSNWISMPKPELKWNQGWRSQLSLDAMDRNAQDYIKHTLGMHDYEPHMWASIRDGDLPPELLYGACMNDRPLWHAAGMLKCGDTLIYTMCGTELGETWMLRVLDRLGYRTVRYPGWGHIDGTVMLIRPGLYMSPYRLLGPLANWDWIDISHLLEREQKATLRQARQADPQEFISKWFLDWKGYAQTAVFDINGISIDENTIMLCSHNAEVNSLLAQHGVRVVHAPLRHRYFWDNGLHCMTLDVRRRGPKESYFSD